MRPQTANSSDHAALRPATSADLPRIWEVRHGTAENRLTDPSLVTDAEVAWYLSEAIFLSPRMMRACRASPALTTRRVTSGRSSSSMARRGAVTEPHCLTKRDRRCLRRGRIGQVKADQKARGRYLGGKVPFGFRRGDDGELVLHAAEQEAIREMAALRLRGRR